MFRRWRLQYCEKIKTVQTGRARRISPLRVMGQNKVGRPNAAEMPMRQKCGRFSRFNAKTASCDGAVTV
jgi:hypothetical protein